jgi:alpha-ketoglutarate-dependent taurine dioxygenase
MSTIQIEPPGPSPGAAANDAAWPAADTRVAAFPYVVTALEPDVGLADWARDHAETVDRLLVEHRAVLLRGFALTGPEDFHAFVRATSTGGLLEYRDRSTPRYEVGERVYVSTIYPQDQPIHLHNEGTYWTTWPLKIYFACLTPSTSGGETPIADVRHVYRRLPPDLLERMREKHIMYVRNYHPGIGLRWQDAFQTDDPAAAAAYAEQHHIELEWRAGGRLRTRQVRPAIRIHPRTGEPVWFNHAAFFHVSSLSRRVRQALLDSYAEADLPYNTYYGDGTPIAPEDLAIIRKSYAAEKTKFPWRRGDVMLLDNMSVAHSREPYTGDRHVIVAMTEAHSDASA